MSQHHAPSTATLPVSSPSPLASAFRRLGLNRPSLLTDVAPQKDLEERSDEIVDTLYVAGCWVADGPDVEDSFE